MGVTDSNLILETTVYEVESPGDEVNELTANIIVKSIFVQCVANRCVYLLCNYVLEYIKSDDTIHFNDDYSLLSSVGQAS